MSTTATLPLPLELTKPVELSSSLEDALKEAFDVANTKYNHQTQVRETAEGIPQILNNTSTNVDSNTNNSGLIVVDDVNVVVDDVL